MACDSLYVHCCWRLVLTIDVNTLVPRHSRGFRACPGLGADVFLQPCGQELKGNIRVFCRVRPISSAELTATSADAGTMAVEFPMSADMLGCGLTLGVPSRVGITDGTGAGPSGEHSTHLMSASRRQHKWFHPCVHARIPRMTVNLHVQALCPVREVVTAL
jgi:hypothetical protein